LRRPLFTGVREFLAQQARAGRDCRVVRGAEPEEALATEPALYTPAVHHVEGDRLQTRPVGFRASGGAARSGFRFFLDGVQYSHLIAYVDNAPLVYHLSAAAILQRDPDRRELLVWHWTGAQECILAPKAYVDCRLLEALGVPVEDTMDQTPDAPEEAVALRALAHSKSQRLRRHAEVGLIKQWQAAGEEGWLMVDGPLMLLPTLRARDHIVGVVKSFGAQFFAGAEQLLLLSLPEGHRTTAFQLPRGTRPMEGGGTEEARRWFSWYVRIRDAREREVDFGLLRVEIPPDPEILGAADEISRWLIAERAPLSTPDPRWGNLLYPIHACEQYLRSMLPERNRVHLHLR
jgi:hypothetical protein